MHIVFIVITYIVCTFSIIFYEFRIKNINYDYLCLISIYMFYSSWSL